jgi:hypothetical protein
MLCCAGICAAQQVVSSGGHVKQHDASIDWIIGGSLTDIAAYDFNFLGSGQMRQLMESGSRFHLFPNPANDLLNIGITPSDTSRMIIEVFDLQGRTLIQRTSVMEPMVQIDIKELSEGTFFVKITDPSNSQILKVEKMIKIKN